MLFIREATIRMNDMKLRLQSTTWFSIALKPVTGKIWADNYPIKGGFKEGGFYFF